MQFTAKTKGLSSEGRSKVYYKYFWSEVESDDGSASAWFPTWMKTGTDFGMESRTYLLWDHASRQGTTTDGFQKVPD